MLKQVKANIMFEIILGYFYITISMYIYMIFFTVLQKHLLKAVIRKTDEKEKHLFCFAFESEKVIH